MKYFKAPFLSNFAAVTVSYVPPPTKDAKDEKFSPRGIPALFLGWRFQPGGKWAGSYIVVPLSYFLKQDEPLRIIEVADVKFPSETSYPLRSYSKLFNAKMASVNSCLLYTSPSPRDQRGSRLAACA